jgi:hypothetical protein
MTRENMLASVVKKVLAAACGLTLCWGSGSLGAEESGQTVQDKSRSYYGWLDKFANPSHQPGPFTHAQLPFKQMNADASAENPSPQQTAQQNVASIQPASGSRESAGIDVSDVIFENDTAEPGKGLGCYYHRAYYSHLPLFKDDSYSLRGAFDVAETYHKPSQDIVSSPDEVPHK